MSEKYGVIVVCAAVGLATAVTVTAIINYDVDDALRIWSGVETLLSAAVGAALAHFFGKKTAEQAQIRAEDLRAVLESNGLI